MNKVLFSIGTKDLREEQFRCGGKGGQNVQKRNTGIRFTHEASGAVGESQEERSQIQNRRKALEKLSRHPKFIAWCRMQAAVLEEGYSSVNRKIDELMKPDNLKIEIDSKCKPNEIVCLKDKYGKEE